MTKCASLTVAATRKCLGKALLIAAISAVLFRAPAARAEVKPGDVITPQNAARVRELVSPGVYYKVVNGMTMKIGPTVRIDWPPPDKEATEKYAGQVRLSEDGRSLVGYVAGVPFPLLDTNDPQVATKIAWNNVFRPQDILASRIDRLPAAEKELLQTLAVIGSEFAVALAREVVDRPEDELTRMLNALQLAEFIYEQPAAGDVEYTFKHALIRDVAYGSLLVERRKQLHKRAGAAIESLFADHLEDHVSDLAHHFIQSGNATKAVRYLITAGQQALERSAFVESQAQLQKGLELVGLIHNETERARLELKLQLALGEAFMYVKGPVSPEAEAATRRAEELSERFGSDAQRFTVLTMRRNILIFRGNLEGSLENSRTALALAERTGNPDMIAAAWGSAATPLWTSGRLAEALQSAQRSMGVGRIKAEWTKYAYLVSGDQAAAFVLLLLGYPDQAERANRAVLAKAKQSGRGASAAATDELNAGIRSSFLYIPMQRPDRVRDLLRPGLEAMEQAGLAFEVARSRLFLGWAIARLGNPDEGIAMIRSAVDQASATGVYPIFLIGWTLPDVLVRAARYEEALVTLDRVLSDPNYSSAFVMTAELHRLKGMATLGRDPSATVEAEAWFRKAIEIARDQSAKWWELRATVSLARLLRDSGARKRRVRSSPKSTTGSPRVSTPPT